MHCPSSADDLEPHWTALPKDLDSARGKCEPPLWTLAETTHVATITRSARPICLVQTVDDYPSRSTDCWECVDVRAFREVATKFVRRRNGDAGRDHRKCMLFRLVRCV